MSIPRGLEAFSPDSSISDGASLSQTFFNSPELRESFGNIPARESAPIVADQIDPADLPDGYRAAIETDLKDYPLLDPQLAGQIKAADELVISSPSQNSDTPPDYRLVKGEDGSYHLEKVNPNADPLEDGKINIEMDPGDKELAEAIKESDRSLKEYIRELMHYFTKNNPGSTPPVWWTDILNSEPNIPEQSSPIPIKNSASPPPQAGPESAAQAVPETAPETAQDKPASAEPPQRHSPDTRSSSGRGSSGGSSGGASSRSRSRAPGGNDYSSPAADSRQSAPSFQDDSNFMGRLKNMLYGNESGGNPQTLNEWDVNGISVGLRQWHAGGELPELLNAWQEADPQKFNQYFDGRSVAEIDRLGQSRTGVQEILPGMKEALADPQYQEVQTKLVDDFLATTVHRGMEAGLSTERELAQYVDLTNQSPAWAEEALPLGAAPGDQSQAMEDATRNGRYGRYASIQNQFTTDEASLVAKAPEPTQLGEQLAQAALVQDSRMAGTGNCAAAVQRALAAVGLEQFVGSGDAWDMLDPLQRSGLFEVVPMNQATVGDIIVRPPSANRNDNSVHGDISVVTARNGSNITQTNDATYRFDPDNARYDGRAVFLRYRGADSSNLA